MLRESRKVRCSLKNDTGLEPGEVCTGEIVGSYMGHVEGIEFCLMSTSEPMAVFESVLLNINK